MTFASHFHFQTGRRNVRCDLCDGAIDENGLAIDANVGTISAGLDSFCGGPARGQCLGMNAPHCDTSEPSRPCPPLVRYQHPYNNHRMFSMGSV